VFLLTFQSMSPVAKLQVFRMKISTKLGLTSRLIISIQ